MLLDAAELLFSLGKIRMALLLDRVPSFYLCYKELFTKVALHSKVSGCENEEIMVSTTHKLEK